MNLSTKGTLWAGAIAAVVAMNSLLTIYAVRELRLTDQLTAQDYEIALTVRHLRAGVLDFYARGRNAGSEPAGSAPEKEFTEARARLAALADDRPAEFPEAAETISRTKRDIRALLAFEPHPEAGAQAISVLNPEFRERFEAILEDLDRLVDESAAVVRDDRMRNETIARRLIVASVCMFVLAIGIVLARLIFMRRTILLPIQSLVETVRQVQRGDLSVRWRTDRQDELGVMGRTINETVAELEQRRAERIQLIGSIAHDLRNPLAALGLSCDLLLRRGARASAEATLSVVRNIRSQVGRLQRMTDDLLQAASSARPGLELALDRVDVATVVTETLQLFRNSHADRRFLLRESPSLPEIRADRDRIAQVLTNLLSNATKYSPAGSDVELRLVAAGGEVQIAVTDHGIGIPEEKKEAVFLPFTRLEEGRTMSAGLGLGLSTVQSIVRAHGGKISLESRRGEGTTFQVSLPIDGPQSQAS
jgi:signal transduction histidine kinase